MLCILLFLAHSRRQQSASVPLAQVLILDNVLLEMTARLFVTCCLCWVTSITLKLMQPCADCVAMGYREAVLPCVRTWFAHVCDVDAHSFARLFALVFVTP